MNCEIPVAGGQTVSGNADKALEYCERKRHFKIRSALMDL